MDNINFCRHPIIYNKFMYPIKNDFIKYLKHKNIVWNLITFNFIKHKNNKIL